MSPALRPVYDDRSTAMIIMIIAIIVLLLCVITFLCLWLFERHNSKNAVPKVDLSDNQLVENELRVLSEYRKLDEQGKELVNSTIQTLNSKTNRD